MIKKNVMNFLRHQFLQKKSQKYQIFIRKVIKIPLLKSFFTKDTFTTCHVFSSICVCLILTIKVKCQHAFGSQRNSSLLRHYFRSIFVVFLWELSNVPKKKKIQAGLSHIFNQEKKKKKTSGLDVSPQCLWDFSHFSEMSKIPLSHQTNPAKGVLLQP